uniref:Uncharacterized protein n=1 Tax=Corethron hystrix TaxID=216773 RepID=A0A7S1BDA7_9STRA|mmetsp:Transcript_22911/g.52492  ORF Transcript_22911/g.52492 Transcript_22911/m.52492 type:complete len:187 (+) Transcript_22911:274-834(+)
MLSFETNTENEVKTMCLTPVAPISPLEMTLSAEHECTFLRINEKEATPKSSNMNEDLHALFVNNRRKRADPFLIPPSDSDLLYSGEGNTTPRSSNKTERLYIPLLNNNYENQTNMLLIPSFKQLLRLDFHTTQQTKLSHDLKRKKINVDDQYDGHSSFEHIRFPSNQNKKNKNSPNISITTAFQIR